MVCGVLLSSRDFLYLKLIFLHSFASYCHQNHAIITNYWENGFNSSMCIVMIMYVRTDRTKMCLINELGAIKMAKPFEKKFLSVDWVTCKKRFLFSPFALNVMPQNVFLCLCTSVIFGSLIVSVQELENVFSLCFNDLAPLVCHQWFDTGGLMVICHSWFVTADLSPRWFVSDDSWHEICHIASGYSMYQTDECYIHSWLIIYHLSPLYFIQIS